LAENSQTAVCRDDVKVIAHEHEGVYFEMKSVGGERQCESENLVGDG